MGRFNVSSPMGYSWERITSLLPWVTHGKLLCALHSLKMLDDCSRSVGEPYFREDFT